MKPHSVIIVEDDKQDSGYLKLQIESLGCQVAGVFDCAEDLLNTLKSTQADVILMGVFLSGKMDGITAAKIIYDLKKIPVIILSSHIDTTFIKNANKSHVFNYLLKPVNSQQLQAALMLATHQHQHDLKVSKTYNDVISHLADGNVRMALFNHTQEKLRENEKNLLADGNHNAFFKNIITSIAELTGALYGVIVIFDDSKTISKYFTYGMPEDVIKLISEPMTLNGLLSSIFKQNTATRVDDISSHPDFEGFPPGHPLMRTFMGMPLITGSTVKGAIYLADKNNAQTFNENDEILLNMCSSEVTHIVERIEFTERLNNQYNELNDEKKEQQNLIKKLKEAQMQVLQSEKMASIGQLAAGVAHEINNPVGYISSNFKSLEEYVRELLLLIDFYEGKSEIFCKFPDVKEELDNLKDSIDLDYVKKDVVALVNESKEGVARVKKIVQDLKDLSHVDDDDEWQYVNIHDGINSTLNIVHNELKYKAEIIKEYGDLPEVQCLPSQINQVFMNILINAAHAIDKRGIIKIRSCTNDDNTVQIEIQDNGAGISSENQIRIFDPFFTTKPVGQGTGLGLSVSYKIIQKHGGNIDLESTPGIGTTFRITLPICQEK